jgi:exopolyphosphatase/guanosine-5'-triphosphate,3'-diphosphate pyrophosphatase
MKEFMPRSDRDVHGGTHKAVHAAGGVYAALDLGTNNCRLLVAAPDGGQPSSHFRVMDSFSRIVRLGEGVNQTGVLSEEAMERTLVALRACQKKLGRYNITSKRFVATEACRRATNGAAFIEHVRGELGLHIDIISSEEEARLAFLGCSSLLDADTSRALVFDIGGGSTELMWVEIDEDGKHRILDWLSIGYGVMNLSDTFGGSNFADVVFSDMVSLLADKMQAFDAKNGIKESVERGEVQLLSTSGTVTTLAAIHLDLPRYDRTRIDGIRLKVSDVRATTHRLQAMRPSERFNHPCIGADRADFIMSGCAIFEAIGGLWPADQIRIADRGVREGIILSLIEQSA